MLPLHCEGGRAMILVLALAPVGLLMVALLGSGRASGAQKQAVVDRPPS